MEKSSDVNLSMFIEKSNGIAEAFILAEDFIKNDPVCLILGDNFFHASNKFFEIETPIKGGTVLLIG